MFQDFMHSRTGILFCTVCIALCLVGRLRIGGGGGGCSVLSLDGLPCSQQPCREEGSQGPLGVLVSVHSWFVTQLPRVAGCHRPEDLAICSLMVAAVGLKMCESW